jgi:hypothetical protein
MRLTTHFALSELCHTATGLHNEPGPAEVAALQLLAEHVLEPLRVALGLAVHVDSGFRSAEVNAAVGGEPHSQHLRGEAADIWVSGISAEELARRIVALGLPFDQIIVENPAPAVKWVHVSYRANPRGQMLRRLRPGVYANWSP